MIGKNKKFTWKDAYNAYDHKKKMGDILNHQLYYVLRPVSFRLSSFFANFNIKPVTVTYIGLLMLFVSWGVIINRDSILDYYLGGIFLFLWCLFDCIDGDLARLTGNKTYLGSISDSISGYLFHTITPIIIAISIYIDPNIERIGIFSDKLAIIAISFIESFCFIFRAAIVNLAKNKFSYSTDIGIKKDKFSILNILPKAILNFRAPFFIISVYFDVIIYYLTIYSLLNLAVLAWVLLNIINNARIKGRYS